MTNPGGILHPSGHGPVTHCVLLVLLVHLHPYSDIHALHPCMFTENTGLVGILYDNVIVTSLLYILLLCIPPVVQSDASVIT